MNDLIIIGAGPAGLSAGIVCAKYGLKVLIIDEFMYPGGRLLGQLYEEPNGDWWNGIEESNKLNIEATELGVEIKISTSVMNIEKEIDNWNVYTENEVLQARFLLLATGAAESPIPVQGWTLPGVMSIGAAQVMTNVHRVKPGNKGIIIGINILSVAIAMELQLAGIEVASLTLPKLDQITETYAKPAIILDSLLDASHMAPNKFIQLTGRLLKSEFLKNIAVAFYPRNGVKLSGLPINLKKAVTEIYGKDQVEGVIIANINRFGEIIPGSEKRMAVDFVCIAGGLYPLTELAALAGCPFDYIEELGGYIPLHNEKMETTIDDLFVAGNITGIEGAKVAIAQGTTAGFSILDKYGFQVEKELNAAIESVNTTRDNAPIQFHPDVIKGKQKVFSKWENHVNKSKALTS